MTLVLFILLNPGTKIFYAFVVTLFTEFQHKQWPQSFHHHMHEKRKLQELELISNIHINDYEQGNHEWRLVDPVENRLICKIEMDRCITDSNSSDSNNCDTSDMFMHPVMKLIKAKAALAPSSPDDYLCTGLVAVLPEEPCLMCAMSLTHSRIRGVLLMDNEDDGKSRTNIRSSCGPYRTWGLHEMSRLNHNSFV